MVKPYYPYLALMTIAGFGRADCLKLPQDHARAFAMLQNSRGREELARLLGREVPPVRWDLFESQLEEIEKGKVGVVSFHEPAFPSELRLIPQPPVLLFFRGCLELLGRAAVAVVGTRNPSRRGRAFARVLARGLAQAGVVVVSGLARGIDTAAHEGALEGGAGTVAVLGTGLDVPYPRENEKLMERIASEGCLISEQLVGTGPARHLFPQRNRLISALAQAVVVAEAGRRSGALITAHWALEQGRDVGAVPGPPKDPHSAGCNDLIKRGAFLVEGPQDVFAAVPRLEASLGMVTGEDASTLEELLRACARICPFPEQDLRLLLQAIRKERGDVEAIALCCGRPVQEVQRVLSALEIEGLAAIDEEGCYYFTR